MLNKTQSELREIYTATKKIHKILSETDGYTIVTWDEVGFYVISQSGLDASSKHAGVLADNLQVLERIAGASRWTEIEIEVLRMFYQNNCMLVARVATAAKEIETTMCSILELSLAPPFETEKS